MCKYDHLHASFHCFISVLKQKSFNFFFLHFFLLQFKLLKMQPKTKLGRFVKRELNQRSQFTWKHFIFLKWKYDFISLFHQYFYFHLFVLLTIWAPQGPARLVHSLPMKSRKRVTCDLFHMTATHASLVYDITDTDCWAQKGSTHGHVFKTFKH